MNGATSLETGLPHDIPVLLVGRVTMAAMSGYCQPFTAVLVNTVAIHGSSGQIHRKAEMAGGLHTTRQTYSQK